MGIDLPRDIGTRRLPWPRLRRIIEYLPEDSATARARRDHRPTLDLLFQRRIDHGIRTLIWQQTEDGSKGQNAPEPVPLQGELEEARRDSLALDEKLAQRQARRQAELAQLQEGG